MASQATEWEEQCGQVLPSQVSEPAQVLGQKAGCDPEPLAQVLGQKQDDDPVLPFRQDTDPERQVTDPERQVTDPDPEFGMTGSEKLLDTMTESRSEAGSNVGGERLAEKLFAAQRDARRRRWKITGTCTCLAVMGILPGLVTMFLSDTLRFIGMLLLPLAFSLLLVGIMPTDRRLIYKSSWLATFGASLFVVKDTRVVIHRFQVLLGATSDEEVEEFPEIIQSMWLLSTVSFMVIEGWAACMMVHGIFRLHPAALLKRLWRIIVIAWSGFGITFLFIIVLVLARGPEGHADQKGLGSGLGLGYYVARVLEHFGLSVLFALPNGRNKLQAWLASRGEDIGAAAAVAALMAGHDPHMLRAEALRIFRYVSFDKVSMKMMVDEAGTLDGKKLDASLYNESSPASPGKVDAFISHSWHDPAAEKFEALERWSAAFKKKNGRAPRCWLDKYCIDQTSLTENLRCLPVFLAGCNRLVICWGPTFISRLWCVLELFVFLMVGGKVENIYIIPIGGMDMRSIGLAIDSFTLSDVKAFSQDDLDHILGVMEAASGDPAALMREMLTRAVAPESDGGSRRQSDNAKP